MQLIITILSYATAEKSNIPTPSENQYLKSPIPSGNRVFNLTLREKLNQIPIQKKMPIKLSKNIDFFLNKNVK